MWIGFDLGGTKMLAVAYDDDFQPLARVRRKTGRATVETLLEVVREVAEEASEGGGAPRAIGLGCPGPIDVAEGVLLDAPNLGWRNVPLRQQLEEAFGCPATLVNDVDAGLFGEVRFGVARGSRSALGVFPGTGIGGAFVHEGAVFTGPHRTCMEIGHLAVQPDGPLCGCGRRGCLEAVASRLAIASAATRAAYRGEAPHLLEHFGTDLRKIRSKALRASIEAGDDSIERIVRDAARSIGHAVGSVINLLAPETVVLGGGLVEALSSLYLEEVNAGAAERVMRPYEGTYRVHVAELGDDAAVIGAASWARTRAEALHRPATHPA